MTDASEQFSLSMHKLGLDAPAPRIAVAVSGGGDSVALTLLMNEWAKQRGGEIYAVTVDHGLRPGSRDEAEVLHEKLKKRGIRHDIFGWAGEKPLTNIQERARDARYALLLDACRRENIPVLAAAHNMEDQIETFWMRLSKGSGLDGLAGMAPSRMLGDIRLIRPLLGFSRADLRQVCRDFGEEWVEDPSNANPQFLRVKLRQFETLLNSEGLTPLRLAQTMQKFEEARAALQFFTDRAAAGMLDFHEAGFATLSLEPWKELPADIQRRILSTTILAIAPRDYGPGFEALEQLRSDMMVASFAGCTLGGCDIFPAKDGAVLLCREAATAAPRAALGTSIVWDGFQVLWHRHESSGAPGLEVGILGEEGLALLRQIKEPKDPLFTRLESLPFKARKTLPALWKGQNLVAVPYLNWTSPDAPKEAQEVRVSFLPHQRKNAVGA